MTRWAAFAGITVAVLILLLVLARASQSAVAGRNGSQWRGGSSDSSSATEEVDGSVAMDHHTVVSRELEPGDEPTAEPSPTTGTATDTDTGSSTVHRPRDTRFARYGPGPSIDSDHSTEFLLINVAISQGLLGIILIGGAVYAQIPPNALGLSSQSLGSQVATGVVFGVVLAMTNVAGTAIADTLGLDTSADLRRLLAPDSAIGWALLLGVVLPTIAGFEELLFRGALVGAFAAGYGISPWLLAVLSSLAFAVGHGAQGMVGMLVTGLLGFVLAAGFVLTGSLVVVLIAHYLVNALEFLLHEGVDVDLL